MINLFMKDGRVKSTLLLNSFCFSIAFLAIYGLTYGLLLPGLDHILSRFLPATLCTILESGICGFVGSLICATCFFLIRDKRVFLVAYIWLFIICAVLIIGVWNQIGPSGRNSFLYIAVSYIWAPILAGGILSVGLYKGWFLKEKRQSI